ncbi:WD40-repeat-containing domain protein, partial [Amylocystis lapponica]
LQSFVSSHKADVFKCYAQNNDSFLTVPYACAYSHAAKRGGISLLAVATEQGLVHILNTSKRRDWDFAEPQRTTFQPHTNGIFDAQWSPDDSRLATASGDHSARVSAPATAHPGVLHVLRAHTGTVKCVAWDPTHAADVLCTGGRDGTICVWDLRAGERRASLRGGGADESGALAPVLVIPHAHDVAGPKPRARRGKLAPAAPLRSITSLVFPPDAPHALTSSGSCDGVLRQWDLRLPARNAKAVPVQTSCADPTTAQGTRRARGLTSLAAGRGPSAGLLFALGTDARVHAFAQHTLAPLGDAWALAHARLQTRSFYVRLAAAPCGRWLASGSADGRVLLFDVGDAASGRGFGGGAGCVELRGQTGEVGAVDWAEGMLATCADDGTVRVWRPDVDVYRRCVRESAEMKWGWSWAVDEA